MKMISEAEFSKVKDYFEAMEKPKEASASLPDIAVAYRSRLGIIRDNLNIPSPRRRQVCRASELDRDDVIISGWIRAECKDCRDKEERVFTETLLDIEAACYTVNKAIELLMGYAVEPKLMSELGSTYERLSSIAEGARAENPDAL